MTGPKKIENKKEIRPYWLWQIPPERRCTARSKRTGLQCQQWAMRGKTKCRFHGGKSSGPRSKQGIDNVKESRTITGGYTLEQRMAKTLRRVEKIYHKYDRGSDCVSLPVIVVAVAQMNSTQFFKSRPQLLKYCRGRITVEELFQYLSNCSKSKRRDSCHG